LRNDKPDKLPDKDGESDQEDALKTNYYLIPIEFLEKLNAQNKAIWKNQLKQDKKLDEIMKIISKIQREDSLLSEFFEVSIIFVLKKVFFLIKKFIFFTGNIERHYINY
jgi:hypothetical protein